MPAENGNYGSMGHKVVPASPDDFPDAKSAPPVFAELRAWDASTCEDPSHAGTPVTCKERIKLVLMFPLGLVRIVLCIVGVLMLWLSVLLFTCCSSPAMARGEEPLSSWRRCGVEVSCRIWLRLVLWTLGFWWISVDGKPASRQEAPIVVGNHPSFIDPIVLLMYLRPSIIGAAERVSMPVVSTIFKGLQMISVSRHDPASRDKVRLTILQRSDITQNWPQLLVFPEGTCNNQRALCTFKSGAFDPKRPIQPVTVAYNMPDPSYNPAFVHWGHGLPGLVMRLMFQPYNTLRLTYLPVEQPAEAESGQQYADRVRAVMAQSLGIGLSQYSSDDSRVQTLASNYGLPLEVGTVRLEGLRKVFPHGLITTSMVRNHLREFVEKLGAKFGNGYASVEAIEAGLAARGRRGLREVVRVCASGGRLSFRTYLVGIALPAQFTAMDKGRITELAWAAFSSGGAVDKDGRQLLIEVTVPMKPPPQALRASMDYKQFAKWSEPLMDDFAAALRVPVEEDEIAYSPGGSPRDLL